MSDEWMEDPEAAEIMDELAAQWRGDHDANAAFDMAREAGR